MHGATERMTSGERGWRGRWCSNPVWIGRAAVRRWFRYVKGLEGAFLRLRTRTTTFDPLNLVDRWRRGRHNWYDPGSCHATPKQFPRCSVLGARYVRIVRMKQRRYDLPLAVSPSGLVCSVSRWSWWISFFDRLLITYTRKN